MFNLVKTSTKDKVVLNGLFLKGDKSKPIVLHIHGFEGDFFTNKFISVIANKLKENNIGFLTVQTRGMANDYDLNGVDGKFRRYGAHFELLKNAYLDIDAWIEFLEKQGYYQVILQGHSLGTIKVVRYLFEGSYTDKVKKLILLAPFDKTYLAEDFTKGKWREYLNKAKEKVKDGKGDEIISKHFDSIVLSYQTYVSWYEETDLSHMFNFFDKNYSFPTLNKIRIPVKVIVGTKDEYFYLSNPEKPQGAIDILKNNIKDFSWKLVEDAKHNYNGYEDIVANGIYKFLKES